MGTLMACVLAQAAEPGRSCQTGSKLRSAASASLVPAAGRARVTVRPGGSGGRARQDAPDPARISPRWLDRTTAAAPLEPKDADTACAPPRPNGEDSLHR